MDTKTAAQILSDLSQALQDASNAVDPLITQLQADGKWGDAQTMMRVQADLLADSTKVNAIAVQAIVDAASSDVVKIQEGNAQMKTPAQAFAADEANIARFVSIATAAGQVVAGFTPAGGVIAVGKALSALTQALG